MRARKQLTSVAGRLKISDTADGMLAIAVRLSVRFLDKATGRRLFTSVTSYGGTYLRQYKRSPSSIGVIRNGH